MIAKRLSGDLTNLQLMSRMVALHYEQSQNHPNSNKTYKTTFPNAPTRPSNQLLSKPGLLKPIFAIDPKWTIEEHVNKVNKLLAFSLSTVKLVPTFLANTQYDPINYPGNKVCLCVS